MGNRRRITSYEIMIVTTVIQRIGLFTAQQLSKVTGISIQTINRILKDLPVKKFDYKVGHNTLYMLDFKFLEDVKKKTQKMEDYFSKSYYTTLREYFMGNDELLNALPTKEDVDWKTDMETLYRKWLSQHIN